MYTYFTYNNLNQLSSVMSPGGKVTSYEYDSFGNVNRKNSPDEGTTKYKYDNRGRLRFKLHVATGELVFNNYDALNRLISTGVVTGYSESAFNNLSTESTNSGVDDTAANLVAVNVYDDYTNPGSVFTGQSYPFGTSNLKGRLVAKAYKDKPANNWNYDFIAYDNLGRITSQKVGTKNLAYNYDNLGNVTSVNINNQYKMLYEYDNFGRLKKVYSDKTANGNSVKPEAVYSYFNDDQLKAEKLIITPIDLQIDTLQVTTQKNYTGIKTILAERVKVESGADVVLTASNRITLKPGFYAKNGSKVNTNIRTVTEADYDTVVVTNAYDATRGFLAEKTNSLKKVSKTGIIPSEVFFEGLGYNEKSNGNIVNQTVRNNQEKGNWFTYSYDAYNRLTGASCNPTTFSSTYTYDSDGNFLTKNTGNDNISYNYVRVPEPDGDKINQLKSVVSSSKGTKTFVYDAKGRMTTDNYSNISLSDYNYQNLPLTTTGATYSYNANGERITKNNEYYLRDYSGKEIAIYDKVADTLKSVNLYGNGMIGRHLVAKNAGTYYAKDHLGSIRTTLLASGEIENATDYYPYGEEIAGRTIYYGTNAKYKFTGKERDVESGDDYSVRRYYVSGLGVWRTIDPLSDKNEGVSPYCYVFNNPQKYIDPTGCDSTVYLRPVTNKISEEQVKIINGQVQSVLDQNSIPMEVVTLPFAGMKQLDPTDVMVDLADDSHPYIKKAKATPGHEDAEGKSPVGSQLGVITVEAMNRKGLTEVGLGNISIHEGFHAMGIDPHTPNTIMSAEFDSQSINKSKQSMNSEQRNFIINVFLKKQKGVE